MFLMAKVFEKKLLLNYQMGRSNVFSLFTLSTSYIVFDNQQKHKNILSKS